MTSSIFCERTTLGPCAPSTHATASTTFDLPEPFGPTTTVIPGSSSIVVGSAKDLKPFIVSERRCIKSTIYGRWPRYRQCRRVTRPRRPTRAPRWAPRRSALTPAAKIRGATDYRAAFDRPSTSRTWQARAVVGGVLALKGAETAREVSVPGIAARLSSRVDRSEQHRVDRSHETSELCTRDRL